MERSRDSILLVEMKDLSAQVVNCYSDYDEDFYKIPGIKASKSIYLVKIEGNNMEPTIFQGDIVVCQSEKKFVHLPKESVAVLVLKDLIKVKRLYRHQLNSYFLMSNDNPAMRDWEEIEKRISVNYW